MFIIYDFIFLIFAIFYLPIFLLRKKSHRGFSRRLGIIPRGFTFHNPVWIHAVSVGEAIAVRGLWQKLKQNFPMKEFLISTVTPSGNKIVSRMSNDDYITYLPLDFGFIVKKVIDRIKPAIFIIAETEIWPNLISYLFRKNIPIVVVNGRISDTSFRGYLFIKLLIKPILNKVNMFCVQSKHDAERLLRLGVRQEKIRVTGNMKFDMRGEQEDLQRDYRALLNLGPQEKLFLAGSTHTKEEEIIIQAYKHLLVEVPGLRLMIAPRHTERTSKVEAIIMKYGFSPSCIYQLMQDSNRKPDARSIFVLDTVGNLSSFYKIADVVFVGGSLARKGGHNILEPASWGKPVLFGPHMFNFRDIAGLFLENKVGILVHNAEELKAAAKALLADPEKARALGEKARELILANQGATQLNLEYISKLI
ncbi:3-deoxy-D-manno-octulosonic acid transferase [bacterium]|nr:MAG: 3-deoxy-D-manno-octulosonic acid transferase [bacterium]